MQVSTSERVRAECQESMRIANEGFPVIRLYFVSATSTDTFNLLGERRASVAKTGKRNGLQDPHSTIQLRPQRSKDF